MKIIHFFFLTAFSLIYSQKPEIDSLRGEFTYMLEYKPNIFTEQNKIKELYSLQISDSRAFFISENKLKFDSAFSSQFKNSNSTIDLRNLPPLKSKYLIIQSLEGSRFYEAIDLALFSYNSPTITNWEILDETKTINSFICKKAKVSYKGRDWIAWYSTEIPFPYGPYKFSGLPGLIIKIEDKTGDYNFEVIRSVSNINLKGKTIAIKSDNYKNAKSITKKEFSDARQNFRKNAKFRLESTGTIILDENKQNVRINEMQKKGYNPIELED